MKFFGLILVLALASSQASLDVQRSAIDNGLASLVEQVREILINGDEELGVPVCEPLELDHLPFDIDHESAQVAGTLSNLRVDGLTGFTADTLSFSLIGIRFNYCFNWASIKIATGYTIDGTVIDVVPIYGAGDVDAEVRDVNVCGTITLTTSGGKLVIRTSTVAITLGGFDLQITGLMHDEEISSLVSAVATDVVPQLVEDFNDQINTVANDIIISVGNELLSTMTLADLIGMISR